MVETEERTPSNRVPEFSRWTSLDEVIQIRSFSILREEGEDLIFAEDYESNLMDLTHGWRSGYSQWFTLQYLLNSNRT